MAYNEKKPLLGVSSPPDNFNAFGLFWNIVKSFAGAGTFALPWAVMNAGLWTGVVGIVIFAVFSTYTINTLLQCGQRVMDTKRVNIQNMNEVIVPPSYPEIGRAAMGDLGAILVSLYSGLMCFGVCIAYFILISGNISALTSHLSAVDVILIVLPLCLFLSCLTDLKVLAYTSVGGSVALVVAMMAVIVYGFDHHLLRPISSYPIINWEHIPLFMGNAAFLFCDHVVVLPLAKSCGNYAKFPKVLSLAVVFVTVLNVAFAGLAYAFWGMGTCGNVITNLGEGKLGDVVRIGISVEVLASFPLVSSAGFQSLETGFHALRHVKAFPSLLPGQAHPFFSRNPIYYAFRIGIILVLALLAATITSFGAFVSLVGSFTIMATGFIFPQIFYLRLFSSELTTTQRIVQWLIILFGVGMTILGTWQAGDGLIKTLRHETHDC